MAFAIHRFIAGLSLLPVIEGSREPDGICPGAWGGATRFTHFLPDRVPSGWTESALSMTTAPCDGLQGMVPPVPSANHLPPPMTGEGDHIAGQGAGPSVGVGAAQGPPLGGVLRVVGPDARPSAQAVANVLEGPGADREAAA